MDDLPDEVKDTIRDCINAFNDYGRAAANFMKEELKKAENEEAYEWFSDLYEDG